MEGPPLRAIAERLSFLEKLGIGAVSGNTKAGKERLQGQKVSRIYTVGKRLVIETDSMAILIHFLMFGSYRLNERREGMEPRLSLSLGDNELNFYNCSVKIVTSQEPTDLDPNSDILNPDFAKSRAIEAMRGYDGVIADLLLDQTIFAGVGNIIKNEALYATGIHPASTCKSIPEEQAKRLIEETIRFSNEFLAVKRGGKELKPILKVYQQRVCSRCKSRITVTKMGKRRRRTFFCPTCQILL
jgi:endonuclease-8